MLTNRNKKIGIASALVALLFMVAAPARADIMADPSYLNGSDTLDWGYNANGSVAAVCQTFQATMDNITGATFKLRRTMSDATWNANSKSLTAQIQTDATGCNPSGATVLDSVVLNTADTITTFPVNTDVVYEFDLGASLTVGNDYFLVLKVNNFNGGTSFRSYFDDSGDYSAGNAWWEVYGPVSSTWTNKTPDDFYFAVYGDEEPPVYGVGPTTTIYSPPDDSNVPASGFAPLEARAASSILSASATEAVTFDWLIFHEGTLKGFRLDQSPDLIYGAGYLADRVTFSGLDAENGRWELRARACHGVACGVYSASQFDVVDGSGTGTDAFVLTLPPFPSWTCGILAGFFDGVDCFMEYVRNVFTWFFFPPPLWAFDPSSLFDFWKTRWPIAYLIQPLESWQTGFDAGSACPMPTFFGSEFNGQEVPEYDLCDTLGAVGPAVDGNAFGSATLQWAIYLSGVLVALAVLKSLIDPK